MSNRLLVENRQPIGTRHRSHKIFDVTVDGVSLVTTYRDSFAEEVRARGIDGLIRMLVAKNGELAAKQA